MNTSKFSNLPKTGRVLFSNLPLPKQFSLGQFLIRKSDFWNQEPFPIYCLKLGNLMVKYVSSRHDNHSTHKMTIKYVNFIPDVYRAIEVDILKSNKKVPTVVKIRSNLTRPVYDESLEVHKLAEIFHIYVQALLTRGMEVSIEDIAGSEHFSNSLEEIDMLLTACQLKVLSQVVWDEEMKMFLDLLPYIEVEELENSGISAGCNASGYVSKMVNRSITLCGTVYDPESLASLSRTDTKAMFYVNEASVDSILTYHGLKHYKYSLFVESKEEIQCHKYKNDKNEKAASVLKSALNNAVWKQQWLKSLINLVDKAGILFEVSKIEE